MSNPSAPQMDRNGPFAILRHLSIDVVLGSVGGAYMAAQLFKSNLPQTWFVVLGLSVWLVYTLDRLLDVRRLRGAPPTTARHRFHQRWFVPLAVAWVALLGADIALSFATLPWMAIQAGLLVAVMALGHLGLVNWVGGASSPGTTKEVGVAVVYAAGIWLPAIMTAAPGQQAELWKYGVVGQHLVLALANVLLLSLFERHQDEAALQTSMVQWAGERTIVRVVQLLLGAAMVLAGVVLSGGFQVKLLASECVMLLILMAHAQILFFPELFRKAERYRVWADFSFSFTWIFLLV